MRSVISVLFLTATFALTANARTLYDKRGVSSQANNCVQSLNHLAPLFGDLNERVKRYEAVNGVDYIQHHILIPTEHVAENIRKNLVVACCNTATEMYNWEEISAIKESFNVVGAPFKDFLTTLENKREVLSQDGEAAVNTVKSSAAVLKNAINEFGACLPQHFAAEYPVAEFNSQQAADVEEMYQKFLSYYPEGGVSGVNA